MSIYPKVFIYLYELTTYLRCRTRVQIMITEIVVDFFFALEIAIQNTHARLPEDAPAYRNEH